MKAWIVVIVTALVLVPVGASAVTPNRMAPGPKTYSTHQWVKGFTPAPRPSYLDRRK